MPGRRPRNPLRAPRTLSGGKPKDPARWSRRTRNWTPIATVTLNPERDATIVAASFANPPSSSADAPAFPSRPDITSATARNAGQERSAAARSHAQRPLRREHGEDGEHRTLPGVSTVAPSASAGGTGRQRHDAGSGGRDKRGLLQNTSGNYLDTHRHHWGKRRITGVMSQCDTTIGLPVRSRPRASPPRRCAWSAATGSRSPTACVG